MRHLVAVCVLFVFSSTGYCLSCKQCEAENWTSCSGNNITCPSSHVCLAKSTRTFTASSGSVESFEISCAPDEECNVSDSISSPGIKITTVTTCCVMDNCTPTKPKFSSKMNLPNGLICPACASDNSGLCPIGKTMNCTGEEYRCFRQTAKILGTSKNRVLSGCATKGTCALDYHGQSQTMTMDIICTNGILGPYYGFQPPKPFNMTKNITQPNGTLRPSKSPSLKPNNPNRNITYVGVTSNNMIKDIPPLGGTLGPYRGFILPGVVATALVKIYSL
ncbi:hypothetical protein GDO86_012187 [Hymenochirus boettgeri]|uniref:Phospholipase A2 inhibitor and Ly6/PLAUR domain-containing protein-like n=1 Tax=Hymenochirus boettgeri TaxID=247094 RepID=A0A8T2IPN4_9PIPI|nr:hypothetical protein GDO86_012187 [Hymenochirus boettgeri]